MTLARQLWNATAVPLVATVAFATIAAATSNVAAEPPLLATPQADCGPGSVPETGLQGQVSQEDHDSGRAAEGFTCNTELVGSHRSAVVPGDTFGSIGGFKTFQYVDAQGNECAFYDSTLMFPTNVVDQTGGVTVLDMADPSNPVETTKLVTPGMDQPHESFVMSRERGLLAAITSLVATSVGILDLYDISEDCRQPTLLSTTPLPVLAHESGLSPDGMTFWAASTATDYIFAVDISDTQLPRVIYVSDFGSHGITIGNDGTRTYLAQSGEGLMILDTTQIAERVANPTVTEVSRLDWTSRSIPQSAEPFTSNGGKYLMEIDEFGSCDEVGAARIIDINDEANPFVLSNMRLEVHQPDNFAAVCDDPGTQTPVIQGYGGHYCAIPTRVDPTIVACSMIVSGLRIFDISDVANPVEVAYYNAPVQERPAFSSPLSGGALQASNWAMSAPAFVPERNEVWYTDAFQGFHAVRVTNGAWPTALAAPTAPATVPVPAPAPAAPAPAPLPATGAAAWATAFGALATMASTTRVLRRRRTKD